MFIIFIVHHHHHFYYYYYYHYYFGWRDDAIEDFLGHLYKCKFMNFFSGSVILKLEDWLVLCATSNYFAQLCNFGAAATL